MPATPEGFLDTPSSPLLSSSTATATTAGDETKTTPEQLKTEGIAQNIARRLREQSARLAKSRANAALEREQLQHQQQLNNNSNDAHHRSLHSGSHQGGGGNYRRYNGKGKGGNGWGGNGKGRNQYDDGITAKGKGNGNGRKHYYWKPAKGKGHYGKGKDYVHKPKPVYKPTPRPGATPTEPTESPISGIITFVPTPNPVSRPTRPPTMLVNAPPVVVILQALAPRQPRLSIMWWMSDTTSVHCLIPII